MNLRMAAETVEARWDGIASIAAVFGIVAVTIAGTIQGIVGPEGLLLSVASLAGLGGYSVHNAVTRGSKK
jgi:hypothetical protein